MTYVVVALVVLVVVVLVVALAARRRRAPDDIASFRRQIDALSPEARRPTIDRMKPSADPSGGDDVNDDGEDGT